MSSGAKAVDSQPPRISSHMQCPVADQPCTQQRRHGNRRVANRNGETIPGISNRKFGIAAVDLAPGELRLVAKVLPPGLTVRAGATCPPEPGDPDTVAHLKPRRRPLAHFKHPANDLVTKNHGLLYIRQFTVAYM
jgi:hypothetical protein